MEEKQVKIVISHHSIEEMIYDGGKKFMEFVQEFKDPYYTAMVIATMKAMVELGGIKIPEEEIEQLRNVIVEKLYGNTGA